MTQKFTASIKKRGVVRCAEVPRTVLSELGGGKFIAVLATYGGETHATTISPAGNGRGSITLRLDILRPAKIDAGDRIEIELEPDKGPREPDVPGDLRDALTSCPQAREAFDRASAGMRRQIVQFIEEARRENTRASRVERIVASLAEGTLRH